MFLRGESTATNTSADPSGGGSFPAAASSTTEAVLPCTSGASGLRSSERVSLCGLPQRCAPTEFVKPEYG